MYLLCTIVSDSDDVYALNLLQSTAQVIIRVLAKCVLQCMRVCMLTQYKCESRTVTP
jgi:hypothetical protein